MFCGFLSTSSTELNMIISTLANSFRRSAEHSWWCWCVSAECKCNRRAAVCHFNRFWHPTLHHVLIRQCSLSILAALMDSQSVLLHCGVSWEVISGETPDTFSDSNKGTCGCHVPECTSSNSYTALFLLTFSLVRMPRAQINTISWFLYKNHLFCRRQRSASIQM